MLYILKNVCVCMCIWIRVCVCMCIWIRVCVYVYMDTWIPQEARTESDPRAGVPAWLLRAELLDFVLLFPESRVIGVSHHAWQN